MGPVWHLLGLFWGLFRGLLEASWGLYGQETHLGGVLGVSWGLLGRPKPILEYKNQDLERPRAAPRRENRHFTNVSCTSAFQPQSRPKSQENAPERLRRRLGPPFSAKIVILRRFWLGRAWLRHRFRRRFLKQFYKTLVFYESKWPSWADFLVFYDEFWRP